MLLDIRDLPNFCIRGTPVSVFATKGAHEIGWFYESVGKKVLSSLPNTSEINLESESLGCFVFVK